MVNMGCGKSTKWVLNNTSAMVVSVDTSSEWVKEVQSDNEDNNHRLEINLCKFRNIEPGAFQLTTLSKIDLFYTDYIWQQKIVSLSLIVDADSEFAVSYLVLNLLKREQKLYLMTIQTVHIIILLKVYLARLSVEDNASCCTRKEQN